MDKNNLELYIHTPFCVKKCAYCDFLSFPAEKEIQKQYVNCLIEEIRQFDLAGGLRGIYDLFRWRYPFCSGGQ